MPAKLRTLSGPDVLRILERFGFVIVRQRGSHVKVRCKDAGGGQVTISVPNHRTLKPGTLHSIYRDACRAAPEAELRLFFYTD